jgi:glycosyltransferase involved in cell wall biosynthesis
MDVSTSVALITNDIVGEKMAGPGMRYWELAKALTRQGFDVQLVVPPFVPVESKLPDGSGPLKVHLPRSQSSLQELVMDCDVLMTLGIVLTYYPFLEKLSIPLVADLYDPFLLAGLHRVSKDPLPQQLETNARYLAALQSQLRAGDFFLCAAEKQRDYWLGMLSALGRLNPYTYKQDATFRQLIDVLPVGLPSQPPTHTSPVLKGVHRTIGPQDKVVLWGGGIWDWLDAQTLIRAVPLVLEQRDDVKVFFMGTQRPNLSLSKMSAVESAIGLSKSLGLYDTFVFFNDWVPYIERQNYLLEADIGVSLHLDSAETRFSFRTRLLDYLWAGLPIVATEGGMLGEELARLGVAELVPPQDERAVADRILDLLGKPQLCKRYSARAQQVAMRYHWDSIIKPLVKFCASPRFSADRDHLGQQPAFPRQHSLLRLWHRSRQALEIGGLGRLAKEVHAYLRWRIYH